MQIPLDEQTIIHALIKAGVIPQDSENITIELEIPSGGNYSGMTLEVDEFERVFATVTTTTRGGRKVIPDNQVMMIWLDESTGEEHEIPPTFYEESGTPVGEDGRDMVYLRTEML